MAQRKDNKNRNLLKGEYQRSDGRYSYRYVDKNGLERYVYSWTLTARDKPPQGRQSGKSLRELEKEISAALDAGVDLTAGKTITVREAYSELIKGKRGIRGTTCSNYNYSFKLIDEHIGTTKLSKVTYAVVKEFYYSLLLDNKLKIGTLHNVDSVLKQTFDYAVKMRYVPSNPCVGIVKEIQRESGLSAEHKKSLSPQECEIFVNWIKNDRINSTYKLLFVFLLGTGCRIGEALGLTWDEVDFVNDKIHITKSFKAYTLDGKLRREVSGPKTKSALRSIPMMPEVRQALSELRMAQRSRGIVSEEIDGYSDFVFTSKTGTVLLPVNVGHSLVNTVNKYNEVETERAKEEIREPVLLPVVTCHILRHTFCTILCSYEPNIKVVQTIMGHANSATTLDVYADAHPDQTVRSMKNLEKYYHIG